MGCTVTVGGSRVNPGQGRRCAQASPSRLALRARGLGFDLAALENIYHSRENVLPDTKRQRVAKKAYLHAEQTVYRTI